MRFEKHLGILHDVETALCSDYYNDRNELPPVPSEFGFKETEGFLESAEAQGYNWDVVKFGNV
jgi:hypothetical protein